MCIIIHKPAGKIVPDSTFDECWWCHKDGAGLSYVDGGKLVTKKGYFAKLSELLEEIHLHQDKEMVIHFRRASHGMKVNASQCHPFEFFGLYEEEKKTGRFMFSVSHNGRLDWRSTPDYSDTSCFVVDYLIPLLDRDPWFLDHNFGMESLDRVINHGKQDNNKMVIMRYDTVDNELKTYIINKDAGNESDGVWYSNTTWKKTPKTTTIYPAHHTGMGMACQAYGENWNDEYMELSNMFPEFMKEDEHGWRWSFMSHMWWNVRTGVKTKEIPSRKRPYECMNGIPVIPQKQLALPDAEGNYEDAKFPNLVVVPRDEDVELTNLVNIDHLNKREKQLLIEESVKDLKREKWDSKAIKAMSALDKIEHIRDTAAMFFEECQGKNDAEVDTFILNGIKDGTFTYNLIKAQQAFQKQETN